MPLHVKLILLIIMYNNYLEEKPTPSLIRLKGCVRYIFASLFCMCKREHFRKKEKCFLFHFESSFRS